MALAGLASLIVGIFCYLLARRGRAIGTHPCCVTCNFDLFGLPAERARCPECGADILRAGAVQVGYHRPVLGGMVAGAFLAFLGIGLCCAALAVWWPTFDGSRYKTVGMLLDDLNSPHALARAKAHRELRRRATTSALSPRQAALIADAVLKWQADPAIPWDGRWGNIVEWERISHELAEPQWNQYLQQAIQLDVKTRPEVAVGKPVPLELLCKLKIGVYDNGFMNPTLTPSVTISAGGMQTVFPFPPSRPDLTGVVQWNVVWEGAGEPVGPGKKIAHVSFGLALGESSGGRARVESERDVDYTRLAPGASSVTFHMPATTAEERAVDDAIRWRLTTLDDGKLSIGKMTPSNFGSLWIAGPSVPVEYRIVLRQNGGEWVVGMGLVRANDAASIELHLPISGPNEGVQPGPAELVCVPDASFAEMTADVMEVWGKESRKQVEFETP